MRKLFIVFALPFVFAACCNKGDKKCEATEKTTCAEQMEEVPTVDRLAITASVEIKPEKVDAFLKSVTTLLEKSRAEEGCISYTLYRDPFTPTKFFFFEEWQDQDAIDFHFETEHFKSFGKLVEEYAVAPADIQVIGVVNQ